MTDTELKKLVASLAVSQAELVEQQKKSIEQQKKTDAKLAQVSEMVGSMANTRSEIAEEFFYRSLCENPCLGSLCFHYVYRHLGGSVENTHDEYDVVLLNDNALVIVEVKAKAKRNTFQQLVKRKIPNFTLLFPDYKKYKIYGAVASMVSNDKLIGYAKKHGIFLITQKSRHLSLMNEQVTVFN
jgi:hypothetical protein